MRPSLSQGAQDAAELRVGVGDLGVVGARERARELRRVVPRRGVRRVRVVEVDPEEERLSLVLPEPAQRLVHRLVAGPLDRVHPGLLLVAAQVEVVEVAREALVDPPARVEHEGGHEPARPVAACRERLGERRLLGSQVVAAVVAHAVARRERPGEERGVGRQRERHDRRRALEAQAARGEAVEPGRARRGVTVAADVVGPCRVDRHDEEVGRSAAEPGRGHTRAAQPENGNGCQRQHDHGGEEGSTHQSGFWCGGNAQRAIRATATGTSRRTCQISEERALNGRVPRRCLRT